MDKLKIFFIYFFFGLSFFFAHGQQIGNYISNGSFEDAFDCLSPAYQYKAKYWNSIDSLSVAGLHFRVCNSAVPLNGNTYQYPRTGTSYILTNFFCPNFCGRRYLKNRLKQPLNAGKIYCVKFHINIANTSPRGIDGFSAYFCNSSIDTISQCEIPLTYLNPQINNPLGNVISDTLNWVAISGTFVASGNEKYAVIGNFLADNAVTTASINTPAFPANWTDLCVDDVSCIELNLSAYSGPDQIILPGDSAFIGRQPDFALDPNCRWYKLPNMATAIDTISGLWVKPSVTSTYVVRQELDCSSVKWDTVVVTINHNLVGLDKLQTIADNISLFPNPTSGNLSISFSGPVPVDNTTYSIIDNLGQVIREEEVDLKKSSFIVSTSDLVNGLYQIQFKTSFGNVTKKFVKLN